MLDIKLLEKEPSLFKENLKKRGEDPSLIDKILEINKERKLFTQKIETAKAQQNKVGVEITRLKKEKKDATGILKEMKKISDEAKALNEKLHNVQKKLQDQLLHIPNTCDSSVPKGASEKDNLVVQVQGHIPSFHFKPKDHVTLGEDLDLLDFKGAGKTSGSRFVALKGALALLERALANFMLDIQTQEHGYTEISPPLMVHEQSLIGTGQFPKFKEDVFSIPSSKHYLISTAEIPLVNLYQDHIFKEDELPLSLVAHTPCFRSEAGSYGKDTKGMIRQHQFYKVELVKLSHPEKSYADHEKLTQDAETILKRLELPFQKISLCTGDIGFSSSKCYDLEVWFPSQSRYREISSCSNCEDFQARRAQIRFRGSDKKLHFVHTLNGSGLAVGRTLIALMENYQLEDGSIAIPSALKPYMKGIHKIHRPKN